MIVTGIGDEAGNRIETQIAASKELGWKHLEMHGIEVAGHRKGPAQFRTTQSPPFHARVFAASS